MSVCFAKETLLKVLPLKNKDLRDIAKSHGIRALSKLSKPKLIYNILKAKESDISNNQDILEIPKSHMITTLSWNKNVLLEKLKEYKIKMKNKQRVHYLKYQMIISKSKKHEKEEESTASYRQNLYDNSPWFRKYGDKYSYRDIHMIGKENFTDSALAILLNLVSKDVGKYIISFITTVPKNNVPVLKGKDYVKLHKYQAEKIQEEIYKSNQYFHCCSYEKCFNVFQKSEFYQAQYCSNGSEKRLEMNNIHDFRNKYYPEMYWDSVQVENKIPHRRGFNLIPDWMNKVIPIANGNCLKDSLFKMRELVINKYSEILSLNKFGAINDKKKFTRLANSIDDHDIESLRYFSYLLGTKAVYFINTKGEIIYDFFGHGKDSIIPSFYACFFLIEANNDGVTGHISPIDFGILKDQYLSRYNASTTLKKLYGKKPEIAAENLIKRMFAQFEKAPWEAFGIFESYLQTHCLVRADNQCLENCNGMLKQTSNEKYLKCAPFSEEELKILNDPCLRGLIRIIQQYSVVREKPHLSPIKNGSKWEKNPESGLSDSALKDKANSGKYTNEYDMGTALKSLVESYVNRSGNLEHLYIGGEKYISNENETKEEEKSNNHKYEKNDQKEEEKVFYGFIIDKLKDFIKSKVDKKYHHLIENVQKKKLKKHVTYSAFIKDVFLGKRLDNCICYNQKTCLETTGQFRMLVLMEYKDLGALKFSSISQAIFYHICMKLKCKYVVITSLYNNIIFNHKHVNGKNIFELIYNDTVHLEKGFKNKWITGTLGFFLDGNIITTRKEKDDLLKIPDEMVTNFNITHNANCKAHHEISILDTEHNGKNRIGKDVKRVIILQNNKRQSILKSVFLIIKGTKFLFELIRQEYDFVDKEHDCCREMHESISQIEEENEELNDIDIQWE